MADTPPNDPPPWGPEPPGSGGLGQPPSMPPGPDPSWGQQPPGQSNQPPGSWAPTPHPGQGGFNTPTGVEYPKNSQAVLAFILSIVSVVTCCLPIGIPAAILGWRDMQAADRGDVDPGNRGLALAATIIGGFAAVASLAFMLLSILVVAGARFG